MNKIKVSDKIKLIHGDCLESLKLIPDNYLDSIVTDPPYGLTDDIDVIEVMKCWLNGTLYKHPKKGFMGKDWDSFVPDPLVWKEAYRVLKPGGHLLSFGGTRTYDLLALGIRIAGFEIRDQIQWLYGQGFPKSMDISKAIDSKLGLEREVVGVDPVRYGRLKNPIDSSISTGDNWEHGKRNVNITKPNSDQAKQWEGWGTALKPANEPIVLARKPISEKTVVENVLKWGVGGLNIDVSRISTEEKLTRKLGKTTESDSGWKSSNRSEIAGKDGARWPANLILDEEAAKLLDEQTGELKSGFMKANTQRKSEGGYHGDFPKDRVGERDTYGDSGGASRFFYIAKASTSEKNRGLDNKESEKVNDGRQTPIDNPFQRGETLRKNTHPTVKPVSLIKYLIKLITPKGGICLDMYNGSGTAGCAIAELNKEGFDFKYIGIDREKEYIDISIKRIEHYLKEDVDPSIKDYIENE